MCEKNIMKRNEIIQKLIKDNRIHVRFMSEDFKDLPGYQKLLDDLTSGDLKPVASYSHDMRMWLQYNEINLNEIKDD